MTDSQIAITKKALVAVDNIEIKKLELFPDVPFQPSEEYLKKIEKIINSEKKRESSILHLSARKKIALLIAVIITALTVLSACIYIEQIKDFLSETYGTMTIFFSPKDKENSGFKEYIFSYLPDKYQEIDSYQDNVSIVKVFSDGNYYLSIEQTSLSGSHIQIDTENMDYETATINELTVYYSINNNRYALLWQNPSTLFHLNCHDSIGWEEIEKIITNATPKSK